MIEKNEKRFQLLETKKERLFTELADHTQETLLLPEKEGAWSVIECVHHIYITELGTEMYIRKKTQKPELVPATNSLVAFKLIALKYTFGTPIKFKAPAILPKAPADTTLEKIDTDWTKSRSSLRDLMNDLPDELQKKGIFKHPLIGRISMIQTLEFLDFHFDRHEHQVRRILKAVAK